MTKILTLLLALLALPFAATAFSAVTIQCTGTNDGPAIQAALNSSPPRTVTLEGVCYGAGEWLYFHNSAGNQLGKSVLQGGVLRNFAGIEINGARRIAIRDTEIYSTGHAAIWVRNAIQVEIQGIYISAAADGIVLESIAAVKINGWSQITGGTNGTGLKIGDSPMGFEAVDVDGALFEGFRTSISIGATGNCVNIWLRGVKIDRPQTFGILMEPHGGGNIRNVIVSDFWINGASYPIWLSTADTSGTIARVEITNGHILGATFSIGTGGGNIDHRITGVIYGPLEPG